MTVCVAAISLNQTLHSFQIVTASDFMISTGSWSSDWTAKKTTMIAKSWWLMYSGNDISPVTPIVGRLKTMLDGKDDWSLPEMTTTLSSVIHTELCIERERRVLTNYSLKMVDFIKEGRKLFGDAGFFNIKQQLDDIWFDCDLLICGFDSLSQPHIFSFSGRDNFGRAGVSISHHDTPGFYAIGSGQYSAMSMLYHFSQRVTTDLRHTFINVAFSKCAAHSATGVGKSTWFQILNHGQPSSNPADNVGTILQALWEKEGQPRISPMALETADFYLSENGTFKPKGASSATEP